MGCDGGLAQMQAAPRETSEGYTSLCVSSGCIVRLLPYHQETKAAKNKRESPEGENDHCVTSEAQRFYSIFGMHLRCRDVFALRWDTHSNRILR